MMMVRTESRCRYASARFRAVVRSPWELAMLAYSTDEALPAPSCYCSCVRSTSGQVQKLEKEIVSILADANPLELNYMLPKIRLGLLFYKIKDHLPTSIHRTNLLDLLAVTRIAVILRVLGLSLVCSVRSFSTKPWLLDIVCHAHPITKQELWTRP